jgi:hypothetical protein
MVALRPARMLPLVLVAAIGLSTAPARADNTSRLIAALPFGAGQFQNGDVVLGIFFAGGEAMLGVTSIATFAITSSLASTDIHRRHPDTGASVDIAALSDRIHAVATANRVAFAGWAALTAAGIIEAQVNFRPQCAALGHRMYPSVTATATPVPGGGGLVGARFVF